MSNERTSGSVPIPNRLFDELLPVLKDSELRVLLVVFRATIGWREGDEQGGWRFKKRDWLTHRQLMKRSGCGSSSVSRAIQSLIDASLIQVESAEGEVLATPEQRRRNLGRLYYRPVDKWITTPPRVIAKARTTTYNLNNIKGTRKKTRRSTGLVSVRELIASREQ